MARQINLQQVKAEHYDFSLHLFLLAMRPYMQELNVWDEQEQRSNFAAQWKLEEVRIISVDGNDVGWLQVSELPAEIRLQKFFILPQYQRSGIGSEVLSKLLATWRPTGKKIVLTSPQEQSCPKALRTPWLLRGRRGRHRIQNESVAALSVMRSLLRDCCLTATQKGSAHKRQITSYSPPPPPAAPASVRSSPVAPTSSAVRATSRSFPKTTGSH